MSEAVSRPDIARRDRATLRIWWLVVATYLVVSLILPLGTILSRSTTTYQVDLTDFAFQVSDVAGTFSSDPHRADALNTATAKLDAKALRTGRDGRIAATEFFPEFSFRSPVRYRVIGLEQDSAFLVGSQLYSGQQTVELSSNDFRRVQLRPVASHGLDNFSAYFSTPALMQSVRNSLVVAIVSTILTVGLAFGFAYALTRSCIRFKSTLRGVALLPLLVPSLLPGIALIYLFGNQGFLKPLMFGHSIYGPVGIVIGSVFFTFPHAFLILSTALSLSDARLFEAADTLKASKWRVFRTVTLPGIRYGLVSAAFVVFNLVITDFGLPKVIGGQFNVLAVDIYKQVIGQQKFEMGAVVAVVLLVPAAIAFGADRIIQRRQMAQITGQVVAYVPKLDARRDNLLLAYCGGVAVFIVGILAVCQFAALVKFWPYDLSLSLVNFRFDLMDGGGWRSYANSVRLAVLVAVFGTALIFVGAYLSEKMPGQKAARSALHFAAMLPMAVPGMVLGLAYIFFFNNPANPLYAIYGTMAILVICTITHFYSVAHLTAVTALKQIDPEFEAVSASLKQPVSRLFARVTLPVCLPAVLDISIYLFINAMTTVSAVVFLYAPNTALASIAVLNMDDAGDVAPAAAMGMLIFYTNAVARLTHFLLSRRVLARSQAWRRR